ncbi:PAP2-domain-containing protein [Tothia fuscella]|uniref:PAP2-domain-containing protein n=1 Tax=Tothia fuscella TaxID=1048955 RepID=A0A9P4TVS8_9PEZI|nr:PAP2-domain-containing protein [Tothia fuscella]
MGFLNRRPRAVDPNTTTSTGAATTTTAPHDHHEKKAHTKAAGTGRGGKHGTYPEALNSKPTFGQWIKGTWLDILTMVIFGAIGLGIYMSPPAPSRSFPVTFRDGEIVYPQFGYPLRKEIIPIWASALMSFFIPFAVFLICAIRVRSFWDINNATLGMLYSLIGAAVFQVFLKWLIGGLRPHFLAVCKPDINRMFDAVGFAIGDGVQNLYFHPDICTGDIKDIRDSLESFPSGHTTAAFAGFVFLSLYLNAKLKVFANYHPSLWKLIAVYAPILGATLIGGALTIDEFHNWYDVVAGGIIGTIFAFSAYRMMYASVWDFRFNHIPLARGVPFTYSSSSAGAFHGFHDAVFTHKAGWGHPESFAAGGAPFDASAHSGNGGGLASAAAATMVASSAATAPMPPSLTMEFTATGTAGALVVSQFTLMLAVILSELHFVNAA